jgi:hypothetical protein
MSITTFDRKSLSERFAELRQAEFEKDVIPLLEKLDALEEDVDEFIRMNQDVLVHPGETENDARQRIKNELIAESGQFF